MGIVEHLPAERVKSRVLWARNFTQALHNGDILSAGYPALTPLLSPQSLHVEPQEISLFNVEISGTVLTETVSITTVDR
jgi:hypothetical protein